MPEGPVMWHSFWQSVSELKAGLLGTSAEFKNAVQLPSVLFIPFAVSGLVAKNNSRIKWQKIVTLNLIHTRENFLSRSRRNYFGLLWPTFYLLHVDSFDYWMKSFVAFQEITENARMKKNQDVQNGCPHERNVAVRMGRNVARKHTLT